MLSALSISNFTTVDQLHLEIEPGFVAVTGETGAGKSVMLDAISLAMGGRIRGDVHRDNSKPSELSVSFDLNKELCDWLSAQAIDFTADEDLILRRRINTDGRSRAFINNSPVNINLLKELAPLLVEQHSQHAHHALLDKKTHRELLDNFAGLDKDIDTLDKIASTANSLQTKLRKLNEEKQTLSAQQQLLSYQLEELVELAPTQNEAQELETELKRLSETDNLRAVLSMAKAACLGEENDIESLQSLKSSLNELRKLSNTQPSLANAVSLLDSALIQLQEAGEEIDSELNNVTDDPARLNAIENRLDKLYTIARKHQVDSNDLFKLQNKLQEQLSAISNADANADAIAENIRTLHQDFHKLAKKTSKQRKAKASKLETAVNKKLTQLSMKHCKFKISILDIDVAELEHLSEKTKAPLPLGGTDRIEFLISTIPGKPPLALNSVASGGELSRISLAIKVVAAATKGAGTLIFDEVDVGIGGGVAEVVGELIRELSKNRQVLCVTHLAQVASKVNHHCLVSKSIGKKNVTTTLRLLDSKARKQELARMMSGVDITQASLAQAEELLTPS